jgi:hypothetical protein
MEQAVVGHAQAVRLRLNGRAAAGRCCVLELGATGQIQAGGRRIALGFGEVEVKGLGDVLRVDRVAVGVVVVVAAADGVAATFVVVAPGVGLAASTTLCAHY